MALVRDEKGRSLVSLRKGEKASGMSRGTEAREEAVELSQGPDDTGGTLLVVRWIWDFIPRTGSH